MRARNDDLTSIYHKISVQLPPSVVPRAPSEYIRTALSVRARVSLRSGDSWRHNVRLCFFFLLEVACYSQDSGRVSLTLAVFLAVLDYPLELKARSVTALGQYETSLTC